MAKNEVSNKWIFRLNEYGWGDTICPVCGWTYVDDIHVNLDYKYCPMCGTKLDGVVWGEDKES